MSQRTITTDNLTDREVTESTHYHVTITDAPGTRQAGDKYEIDLTAESQAALVAMLTGKTDEFHKYMRRFVDGATVSKRTRSAAPRNSAPSDSGNADDSKRAREFVKASEFKAPAIKEWGRANGHEVKDGPGVLPSALMIAFAKAHGMPETPANSPEPSAPALTPAE
jgi:hypothetical protein